MDDISKLINESEAKDYYHNEYLPNFDKELYGEPVCFEEFYDNEWQDIVRGRGY